MKKNPLRKNTRYKQSVVTFDIESTSLVEYTCAGLRKPKLVPKKHAFMYAFALYNDGVIYRGRTWEDAITMFDSLSRLCGSRERYIVWVHNLSFEFQFMKDWMKLTEVFCRKSHNVLRCVYKNIEFRDTLALSNCKLEKLAKNEHLGIEKLVGDLDYSKTRHHLTHLTEAEWKYIDNDVKIVAKYIEKKVKEYGCLENIPMTSTGEVRVLFRKELGENLKKIHAMSEMYSASSMELQNLLIQIYAGAYTHCNYQAIDQTLEDLRCMDIASSYPYQMCSQKYPTMWFKLNEEKLNEYFKDGVTAKDIFEKYSPVDYALACKAKFLNIKSKHVHSIISQHKCTKLSNDYILDNGRVYSASILELCVNEIDLQNITEFYNFDSIELTDIYVSKKEYLPKELVSVILKLFKQKTELKDIEEELDNYMRSKARVNGVYGTSVFNIIDSGYYFDEESNYKFLKDEKSFADFKKYTQNPNQYLWYSIGVWVTSYARRQVLTPIKKMSENAIYSDTDSVKYIDRRTRAKYDRMWNHLNAKYKTEFYEAMKFHGFSLADYTFIDKYNCQHYMGIFEEEKPYKRFKSLGSKRYLVEYYDGKMSSTVAGAPKNLWEELGKTNDERFVNFKNGFTMKDCKLTHTYTEENDIKIIEDYNGVKACVDIRSGVCLTPADFTMSLSDEFIDFLIGRIDFEDKDIYRYFLGQDKFYK